MYKTVNEGAFVWEVDNSPAKYNNWIPGKPNSNRKSENCVEVGVDSNSGFWNDEPCNTSKYYICEKAAKGMSRPTFLNSNSIWTQWKRRATLLCYYFLFIQTLSIETITISHLKRLIEHYTPRKI